VFSGRIGQELKAEAVMENRGFGAGTAETAGSPAAMDWTC